MKTTFLYLFVFLIPATFMMSGFANKTNPNDPAPINASETKILIDYLEANGNFINSKTSESLVTPDEVKKNLKNEKYLLIDIRTKSWFDYGHIKGAVNVDPVTFLSHFQTQITPGNFEKIVIICYSGQSAAYYTSLLRLAGYSNVYSMKWGMSSWRQDFAENAWLKNIGDAQANTLEKAANPKPAKGDYPALSTGKTDAKEILNERLALAFAKPYKEMTVEVKDFFVNPDQYMIVNYADEAIYNHGHIKKAVHYTPFKSLSAAEDLSSLPTDKKIVVYDNAGFIAAHAVAYLHLLGYDVANLAYGNNSFMNKEMVKMGWDGFSAKEIGMNPVVE